MKSKHPFDADILRYCQQTVCKAMNEIRGSMRGSNRLLLASTLKNSKKDRTNQTKGVDASAEELIIIALTKKFQKLPGMLPFMVFSEELGIAVVPEKSREKDARYVIFIDPIDGTEFIESLQGGWSLMAVYDRKRNEVVCSVAGDIFLNRLYWASRHDDAEALDFTTHSMFRLDGGPNTRHTVAGSRINMLTSKVDRFRSVVGQQRLLDTLSRNDGRINLAGGSNMVIQVAAGYADAAVEFYKGFATYDILPGLFIAKQAGMTILDLSGKKLDCRLDIEAVFSSYLKDPLKPYRTKFVVAKSEKLALEIISLLDLKPHAR